MLSRNTCQNVNIQYSCAYACCTEICIHSALQAFSELNGKIKNQYKAGKSHSKTADKLYNRSVETSEQYTWEQCCNLNAFLHGKEKLFIRNLNSGNSLRQMLGYTKRL